MDGAGLHVLRKSLWPFAPLYGAAIAFRNRLYDRGQRQIHRLPVPVLSVGNLTVGGTGKTPLVMWLVAAAQAAGRRPGVLARGYGRARDEGLNDEGRMLERRFPGLLQEQDPDRVAGGRRLVERGADLVILDDGFQHRRLHRDCDVLCMDGQRPFADGVLLPAGSLRESRRGVRRASMLVLTRASALSPEALEQRRARLRQLAGKDLPIFAAEHVPVDLLRQPDSETLALEELRGRPVVLLSAIARPESFRATAEGLGADVVAEQRYIDHHCFHPSEVERAVEAAKRDDAWIVVTEKDEARLGGFDAPRVVLRLSLEFLGGAPAPAQLGWE